MDLHDTIINFCSTSTLCQDNRLTKIWFFSSSLGINSNHTKCIPNFLKKYIETKFHHDRNTGIQRFLRDLIDLFNRNLINFVVNIKTFDIFSIAFNHINKLINIVVTSESNVSIMHFVLVHDNLDLFLVYFGQFNLCVELNTTRLCLYNRNFRLFLV
jgi:hypothetical protein